MSELTAETLTTADIDALLDGVSLVDMEKLLNTPIEDQITETKKPEHLEAIPSLELAVIAWDRAANILVRFAARTTKVLEAVRG